MTGFEPHFEHVIADSRPQAVSGQHSRFRPSSPTFWRGGLHRIWLMACCLLVPWLPAQAGDTPVTISEFKVGFDGSFKIGRWAPVEFLVSGPSGKKLVPVLRAADPDGRATLQPMPEITLGTEPTRVHGLVRSGRLEGNIQAQLYESEPVSDLTPITQATLRVDLNGQWRGYRQTTQFWLSAGKQPFLSKGLSRWNQDRTGIVRLVEIPDAEFRLRSADDLDGVDVLVLTGETVLNEESSHAIQGWVQSGGRLLISVGDGVSSLADSPLSQWLPLRPTGQIDVTKLAGLNALVPRSSTLRTLKTIPAGQFDRGAGMVIASGAAEPLIIRAAYGLGQVTMLAIRMDAEPLVNWEPESQGHLASILAGLPNPVDISAAATARTESASELNPAAVTDLQMQLNQSLDHFSQVNRPSHWQVMGWIALFVIVIGPLDYYLVTYVLKRPEWTWGTVIVCSLLCAFLAVRRADAVNQYVPHARQLDIATVDASTRSVAVKSWYGFYSDRTQRLPVKVESEPEFLNAEVAASPVKVSWVSRPSEGFRGMYRTGGVNDSEPAYEFTPDQSGITNFPVEVWSSGALTCDWNGIAKDEFDVTSNLQEMGLSRLTGSIKLNLPGELTDWFVAYNNFAYFDRSGPGGSPAPLKPGTEWSVANAGSNLLRGRLLNTIQQRIAPGTRQDVEAELSRIAYDPLNADPFVIGLTASFYQVLGGESYTGLQNQSLSRFDLSQLVELRRAVVFGQMKLNPTELKLNGTELPFEERTVLVRVVLPVQPSERSSDAPPPTDILNYRR